MEFKASYGIKNEQKNMSAKDSTDVVFREVSSMMNTEGGYLFVGIENDTWNVLGIDDELKSRKSRDNFLGEVYSHLKHNIGKIYGSHVTCELKPISGKQVMVFSVKPSRNSKVWFKPRGAYFKRDVFDDDYGCLYVRTDDNAEPLKKYNEILDWAELRFGVRNI
ncbi:MAG: hypothetical protein CMB57_06150 [Euryarchaeota archaeon]|nr:hypothetical protein [Euryarchaeota archaeon]